MPSAHAGDGNQHWFTIESEHFVVNYHAPLGALARRVASLAERAHEVLVPDMGHEPKEKTSIVLEDNTDGSNGFASVIPRNEIRLFASAPPSKSSLSDHDDWLYGLIAHEYAHIVHLDTIGGLPVWVNRVIGKTWAPNQIQPRWIIEGLATYEESRHSSAGRLRNALFSMNLRMATLASRERRLDEMTNGPRAWPHGTTAYLYGSYFLKYVFDKYGASAFRAMSKNFGSNPIPYGINRQIRLATGQTFIDLHEEWKQQRRDEYGLQKEAVMRAGRIEGRRLTFSGEININPRYTRDGQSIVWQHGPGTKQGRYETMPKDGGFADRKTYAVVNRSGEFDLLSDGSLILEQTEVFRSFYSSQELFRWDPRNGEMQQLTRGVRMRDPAVSPDERQVAFVVNGKSKRHLAVMDLSAGAEPRKVWEGEGYAQAFDPAWSPDGRTIAFTAWRTGGYKDILEVDIETGTVREVMRDRASDVDPVYDPKGRYLYFSSDRSGIYNVYAFDRRSEETFQVTNVLGCALTAAVSPDGEEMTYQGYVQDGYELYQMPLRPSTFRKAAAFLDARPPSVEVESIEYAASSPRPYDPLESLAPQRYDLQLDTVNRRMNLQLTGQDYVGQHSFTLGGTADLVSGHINIGGAYSYNRLWPSFRVAAARSIGSRGGLFIDGINRPFLEEQLGGTLSISLPVLRQPRGAATISFSYDADYLRVLDSPYTGPDPNQQVPVFPESDIFLSALALRFNFSSTSGFVYTLGPQIGQTLSLSMRLNHPAFGSDFRSLNLDYRYQSYFKLPFGRTPILSLRLAGGIRTTDRSRASRYSLGGVPQQDLVQSIIDSIRVGNTGYLRGYQNQAVVGTQMHLLNLEYRQELWNIERGLLTVPFYFRKLHIAGLFDLGNAFDDSIDLSTFRPSLGASLRLDFLAGYFIPGSIDVGYSQGFGDDGIGQYWTLITGSI